MNVVSEIAIFGIIVAGFLIMLGWRRKGLQLLMIVIAGAMIGLSVDPMILRVAPDLIDDVPLWIKIGGTAILGLWVLQALLTALFGKSVASTAVGTIIAQFVTALGRMAVFPFRWLGRLLDFIGTPRP